MTIFQCCVRGLKNMSPLITSNQDAVLKRLHVQLVLYSNTIPMVFPTYISNILTTLQRNEHLSILVWEQCRSVKYICLFDPKILCYYLLSLVLLADSWSTCSNIAVVFFIGVITTANLSHTGTKGCLLPHYQTLTAVTNHQYLTPQD